VSPFNRIPRALRTRLLLSHLVVAFAALGTVLVGVNLVGPGYFSEAMGHQAGDPMGEAMAAATRAAFREAVTTALVGATVVALVAAIAVALALSMRIADPVTRLAAAARRIASGHYAERVVGDGVSELGALGESFNHMADSLEATERRRLELVGDVAHELRTPLTTLDGYLEGLQDGVIEPIGPTWSLLRSETARLTRLVDDLSELWRAETRHVALALETIDLVPIVRDVVERFVPAADARGIALELECETALRGPADADRLAQILGNFLSNAIRYSPDGARVVVAARRSGPELVLSVQDQGAGLTEDQRSRVFERFYRVDPSRSRALGGAGIGLAIARALAAAMGGRTWAESAGPGTGATFFVALPAAGSRP
jgi:signal transduction histidine kinase